MTTIDQLKIIEKYLPVNYNLNFPESSNY